jgi:hypothetical protein
MMSTNATLAPTVSQLKKDLMRGKPVESHSITWQARSPQNRVTSILHGLESTWPDSTAQLLRIARSVTLLTRSGHEVIVSGLSDVGNGTWSGSVAQVAAGAEHIRLGAVVEFHEGNVQAATLT